MPRSHVMRWTGRVFSALAILFFVFDGGIKLIPIAPVTESMAALGWPTDDHLARGLGALLLACTALYAYPRTALLGAVLITGYLGGAMATQLRVGNPLFSRQLFGVYLGLLVWGGLWLRDAHLRAVFPFRSSFAQH